MARSNPTEIEIKNFLYTLPENRIAKYPLKERDQSKLLIYSNGVIEEDIYHHLSKHLPTDSLLISNEAKVVHARLHFKKNTGGKIEVFCLEPDNRYPDITTAMKQYGQVYWKCLLKGASKWKDRTPLELEPIITRINGKKIKITGFAEKTRQEGHSFTLQLTWHTDANEKLSFAEFLEYAGDIPIPPYLKRESERSDETRYQTIFAREEGSVAAPTAGLHFTPYIVDSLKKKDIKIGKLTLHVGAGTFMPVKSEKMKDHEMHSEWIEIPCELIQQTQKQLIARQKIVCIGTTSARTLESAYWIGVQILRNQWSNQQPIAVSQWYPYGEKDPYSTLEVLDALLSYFKENNIQRLITKTQLIIAPGYTFKLLDGLITNFHQPASTLLLMIAALVGDNWKKIYDYALQHNFRFLSYGDGSLLWK